MPTQELAASLGRLAANHLWQSTGLAAVAVLLALALRANHARERYWLWLAASVKFLIPFAVLAAVGSRLGRWLIPATPVSRLPFVMEQIVQPFGPIRDAALPMAAPAPSPATAALLPALLLAFWFCGFVAVLLYRWARWRRVAAAVRSSTPLKEGREQEALRRLQWGRPGYPRRSWVRLSKPAISLVSSSAKLEPGVFGIFRPVLWLPAGIGDRLEDAELEAILAHELCHVRRRDNLFAAIHMAVEAIFWFHPLVWWLGARLVEERERACDEEVLRLGSDPQVYAESILKVCEFYLASPVACTAGVTGGDLKKRIEGIMTARVVHKLNFAQTLLFAIAAIGAVAAPIAAGLVGSPRGEGQAQAGAAARYPAALLQAPAAAAPSAATAATAESNTSRSGGLAMAAPQTGNAPTPGAPGQEQPPDPKAHDFVTVDGTAYVIGVENVVVIQVWEQLQLGCTCVVRPDGKITVPLIGEVTAAGRTPLELATVLTDALSAKALVNPKVTVSLVAVHSKKYYVHGQVRSPGAHDLVVPITVMEALISAGGFLDFANRKDIIIIRGDKRLKFNFDEVLKGENIEQNIHLEPGDMVVVK